MTRILLLSDIHANLVALETVLSAAGEFDALWCLGDVVGYGPAPNECVERVRALNPICLAGNHDWAVLGKLDIEEFNPDARRAILWTRSVLSQDNLKWLDRLPERLLMPEHNMTLVHASPRYPIWEYIQSTALAAENMEYFDTSLCLFGHTHVPIAFRQPYANGRVRPERLPEQRPLSLGDKMLVNPGSVGQPRDGDPRAAFAILDTDTRTLTHTRIEYDIRATQAAMAQARLPRRLIERLDYGF